MLQIVNAVFKDVDDSTCISLIYANQTEEDILCRSDLEKAKDENPDRFKLWYTVDRPPAGKILNCYTTVNCSFVIHAN